MHSRVDAEDETRPLLFEEIQNSTGTSESQTPQAGFPSRLPRLPKVQVTTLSLPYLAETIIAVFAYPFLPQASNSLSTRRCNNVTKAR